MVQHLYFWQNWPEHNLENIHNIQRSAEYTSQSYTYFVGIHALVPTYSHFQHLYYFHML